MPHHFCRWITIISMLFAFTSADLQALSRRGVRPPPLKTVVAPAPGNWRLVAAFVRPGLAGLSLVSAAFAALLGYQSYHDKVEPTGIYVFGTYLALASLFAFAGLTAFYLPTAG